MFTLMTQLLRNARTLLLNSWKLYTASLAPESVKVTAFGRLCVRCVLHLTGKEKMGPEPKGFASFGEMAHLFTQELSQTVMTPASGSTQQEQDKDTLKVENMVEAPASQVASHHNSHLEIGKLPFDKNECFPFVVARFKCLYFFTNSISIHVVQLQALQFQRAWFKDLVAPSCNRRWMFF